MSILREIKKKNDYLPQWYSILINPYFIIRRGLFLKISEFAQALGSGKKILDVGCGSRPYESLFSGNEYLGIDVEVSGHKSEDKKPDKYFDGVNIPYEGGSFDVVICTEVLEHALEPEKLVGEAARVLKPGGIAYVTVPFTWNEHETPYDFRRYTSFGLNNLLQKDFTIKKIVPTIGHFGVVGMIFSAAIIESFKKKNIFSYLLISVFLCFPVQLIFVLLDKICQGRWITSNWVATVEKK